MRHRCRCAVSQITRIRLFPLFFHNGCSQSSRFLPQARRIVGSGDENVQLLINLLSPTFLRQSSSHLRPESRFWISRSNESQNCCGHEIQKCLIYAGVPESKVMRLFKVEQRMELLFRVNHYETIN